MTISNLYAELGAIPKISLDALAQVVCSDDYFVKPLLCQSLEDVLEDYDVVQNASLSVSSSGGGSLEVGLLGPTFATQTVPFSLTSSIVNSTTLELPAITATVAISVDADSPTKIFDVHPAYHVVSDMIPGETVTVTWNVTPLLRALTNFLESI